MACEFFSFFNLGAVRDPISDFHPPKCWAKARMWELNTGLPCPWQQLPPRVSSRKLSQYLEFTPNPGIPICYLSILITEHQTLTPACKSLLEIEIFRQRICRNHNTSNAIKHQDKGSPLKYCNPVNLSICSPVNLFYIMCYIPCYTRDDLKKDPENR